LRIKAVLAYDGSVFEGFQRQTRTERTVTQTVERALASVGIPVRIVGSGRTDAGVHATGQVIHFDLPRHWETRPLSLLRTHLNNKLTAVRFKHLTVAGDDFHSRYDARERIYRYVLRPIPSVFERNYVSALCPGDFSLLSRAMETFVGTHDFIYFHKTGSDPRHTRRTVFRAYARTHGAYTFLYFHADGFLRAQVRMMIHAALCVSSGTLTLRQLRDQLAGRRRHLTGLAPPHGLYLARILY